MIRTFKIYDNLFQNYTYSFAINDINTTEDIINIVKNNLTQVLSQLNLVHLVDIVTKINFHIHNSLDYIIENPNDVIYICSCKKCVISYSSMKL
jgi:hypothetical protein